MPLPLWLVAPLLITLYVIVQAAIAEALGLTVHHIRVGYGTLLTLPRLGRAPIHLGWLPLGGHVLMASRVREEDAAAPDGTCIEDLPVSRRVLLHLSGPLLLAALSAAVWLAGASSLAVVCGLLAASNLAPLPGTAGGQVLLLLVERMLGRPVPGGLLAAWLLAGLLGMGALLWGLLVRFPSG